MTEAARRLPRLLGRTAATGVVLVAVCFGLSPVLTTDFFWQLGAGDWILREGSIPRADPFSYSTSVEPWIDLHWAFQATLALLYRVVGIDGLVLVRALLAGKTRKMAAWMPPVEFDEAVGTRSQADPYCWRRSRLRFRFPAMLQILLVRLSRSPPGFDCRGISLDTA